MWSIENPHAVRQTHSQPKLSVNVWAGIINNTLIGPHFFEDRLNGNEYLNFLQNILPNLIQNENVNVRGMYFQHGGAPSTFFKGCFQFFTKFLSKQMDRPRGASFLACKISGLQPTGLFLVATHEKFSLCGTN